MLRTVQHSENFGVKRKLATIKMRHSMSWSQVTNSYVPMFFIYSTTRWTLDIGHTRPTIFPTRKMAVHDPGWGPEYQEFLQRTMENTSWLPMSQSPSFNRHTDPKLDARSARCLHRDGYWSYWHFISQSCGPSYISSCPVCLTHMTNLMSGFQRTSKMLQKTREVN